MAGATRSGSVQQSWRRFRRRSASVQITTAVIILAVVIGLVVVATGSTSGPGRTGPANALSSASTSSRGVTATAITVVFPVSNLAALAGQFGFAGDIEYSEQTEAIDTFVGYINDHGGINGRRIDPVIADFDPTNDTDMGSLCRQWTEQTPVFAVLDGLGAWEGPEQLCITQQGHTPLISAWSTTPDWTTEGSPYLWWTGPDESVLLKTLVSWAKGAGLLSHSIGIAVGDRPSDQDALADVEHDLAALGAKPPLVETIPAELSEQGRTGTGATNAVEHFVSAKVETVIPLIPENAFIAYLGAEASQHYYPKLLLSDYEQTIELGLGFIPLPFEQELNGQEGVTVETLGGVDDDLVPFAEGGYDPQVESCFREWAAAHPHRAVKYTYIEEQGPIVGWCQVIKLFAAAAEKAGRDLTRRSFVEAMGSIKDFPGTWTPLLSYGPDKFAGPVEYQVVRIHNNVPPSSQCLLTFQHIPQGTCWVVVQHWRPLA